MWMKVAAANAALQASFRQNRMVPQTGAQPTPERSAIEPKAPTRHIPRMSARPDDPTQPQPSIEKPADPPEALPDDAKRPREIGGPKGPEPTRYGDWEVGGRCTDF
jgi:hypothetical protein